MTEYNNTPLWEVLNEMLKTRENDEIEFKSAKGGFPGAFWDSYSAFANTNGGTIVLGVTEKHDNFIVDGLTSDQVEKYKKDFFSGIHNRNTVNVALLTDADVKVEKVGEGYVIFFFIPRASIEDRPVYKGLNPYNGSYRRDNEGDYHCSPQEVKSMFADANLANSQDGRILDDYDLSDLDFQSVKQYRNIFKQASPDHPWIALDDNAFLGKINAIKRNRKTNVWGVTIAGMLMFGTYSALQDAIPNFFPDFKEIDNNADRWCNRIYPDGTWESNLFQFYIKILPILQGYLPRPFKLDGNTRVNETSAHIAIREAFANCLMHADYSVNASLLITKRASTIEFSNPGTMLIPISQYYAGGQSICRNKYLQTMFMYLSSAEKAGSGSDKILKGWEEQNWKRPYIREEMRPNRVVLTMQMESLIDESTIITLQQLYGKSLNHITHNQKLILALALSERTINNDRLQAILDLHRSEITLLLRKMVADGLLTSDGYGRGMTYRLSKHINSTTDNDASNDASNDALPQRHTFEQLRQLIIDICSDWHSKEEIARLTGKSEAHIKNNVLPKMQDDLDKEFPNIPRHPAQRYRAKK